MVSFTIHTLEARSVVWLDLISHSLKSDRNKIYIEINESFKELLSILQSKNVSYEKLKKALIPQTNRIEAAFVFDSSKVDSAAYGYEVFNVLIPLLNEKGTHSVLVGDYIGENHHAAMLKAVFLQELNPVRKINYVDHSLYYIVYVNNLTKNQFDKLNDGLKLFSAYVGFFDLSYSSAVKTILSTILVRLGIKHNKLFIFGSEGSDDNNYWNIPFEYFGYEYKGVETIYSDLFLSYKIEREALSDETDSLFSINAVTPDVARMDDLQVVIEENKWQYLISKKRGSLERVGLLNIGIKELEAKIKGKLFQNYIYNLTYLQDYQTCKFNMLIELPGVNAKTPIKMLLAFQYHSAEKLLRLITMY